MKLYAGASDQAVQLLMQTAVSSPNHYADALRACLIASLKRPETAISTIKVLGVKHCLLSFGSSCLF